MALSIKRPTSAQVTVSRFGSSSPASGSVLTAWSLEPALEPVSPSLSAPPLHALSLSQKQTLKKKFQFTYFERERNRAHEWGRGRERGGERENPKQHEA